MPVGGEPPRLLTGTPAHDEFRYRATTTSDWAVFSKRRTDRESPEPVAAFSAKPGEQSPKRRSSEWNPRSS